MHSLLLECFFFLFDQVVQVRSAKCKADQDDASNLRKHLVSHKIYLKARECTVAACECACPWGKETFDRNDEAWTTSVTTSVIN